jgi:hypothetical protein
MLLQLIYIKEIENAEMFRLRQNPSHTISIIDLRRILPFPETSQERTNELHRTKILETPLKTAFLHGMDFFGIIFSREKS